jgi:CubicO group peptidase (beta-lactamase class C family)
VGSVRSVVLVLSSIVLLLPVGCSTDPQHEPGPDPVEPQSALLAAIHRDLDLREGHENIEAVLVRAHGKRVVDWYNDVPTDRHWDIGWVTVAFVSTLIGIAIDEGDIPGLDATLRQLLPEHEGEMSPAVASTTLRDVLTMTGGFPGTIHDAVTRRMSAPDPVAEILRAAQPSAVHRVVYSSQGAHLLSAVLAKATGMSVLEYARSHLLDPLDIDTSNAYQGTAGPEDMEAYEAADFAWPVDSTGLSLGWNSLKLSPSDLAKLGQLYLDGGRWKGEQLVSSSWVQQATEGQEENVSMTNNNIAGTGYGYGWWRIDSGSSPAYFMGDVSGQLLEVVPSHSMVVVVASQPDFATLKPGIRPEDLTFLVDDVIAPQVRP